MGLQGMEFMKEMLQIAQQETVETSNFAGESVHNNNWYLAYVAPIERNVQVVSDPHFGSISLLASPAQFGAELEGYPEEGEAVIAEPYKACSELRNGRRIRGRIAIVQRGGCMFQEKARYAQNAGAIGVIVIGRLKPNQQEHRRNHFRQPGGNGRRDFADIRDVGRHRDRRRHRHSGGVPLPLPRTKADQCHPLLSDRCVEAF